MLELLITINCGCFNISLKRIGVNAIKKYGSDNIEWCVLETTPTRAAANEIEQYWINYFKSNVRDFGYNMTEGGEGIEGFSHSEEAREKIGNASRGIPRTEEVKQKIAAAQKGVPRRNHTEEEKQRISEANIGREVSEETRRKISEANKGRIPSEETLEKLRIAQQKRWERVRLLKANSDG